MNELTSNQSNGLRAADQIATRRGEKMSERIAREIVHDIVARGLGPGAKLPSESVMLSQFEVGRGTLREALRILEVHGLITIRSGPGGGPIVVGARSQDFGRTSTLYFHIAKATFRDLAEARRAIEPLMARLAAERQDPDAMERLNRSIERAREVTLDDDKSWAEASTEFHGVVAGLSGNRILDLFGESLKNVWIDRVVGMVYPRESREKTRTDHEAVANAIVAGDGDTAERLMREHMDEFQEMVLMRFSGMINEIVDWR